MNKKYLIYSILVGLCGLAIVVQLLLFPYMGFINTVIPFAILLFLLIQLFSDEAKKTQKQETQRLGELIQDRYLVGGAWTAVALGVVSIVGSFIAPFSALNAAIGLAFGVLAIGSTHRTIAITGIGLSVVGLAINVLMWYPLNYNGP